MTDHPAIAAKCTKAQIEAFDQIAVNQIMGHYPKVLDALSEKGLIEFVKYSRMGVLGRFTWREPFVPIPIHVQWCKWCDENVEDENNE